MTANEEYRQLEIARELLTTARTLAHSTRNVPTPATSYPLLGELVATVDALEQVCRQLGAWHRQVVDGKHYDGEDGTGDDSTGTVAAAARLEQAATTLDAASVELRDAHAANGVVRWIGEPE